MLSARVLCATSSHYKSQSPWKWCYCFIIRALCARFTISHAGQNTIYSIARFQEQWVKKQSTLKQNETFIWKCARKKEHNARVGGCRDSERENERKWESESWSVKEKQFIAGKFIGWVYEITAQVERVEQTIRCELLGFDFNQQCVVNGKHLLPTAPATIRKTETTISISFALSAMALLLLCETKAIL